MELNILHLYPHQMDLYGEYANLSVLRRHLEALGVTVKLTAADGDTPIDFTGMDLIYMGAGTEPDQKAILKSLLPAKESLLAAMEKGAQLFFTGSAMEVLGQSVNDAQGQSYPCLGLASFTSTEGEKRIVGDVIAASSLLQGEVVGFMNKCSTTVGVETPLFESLAMGFGNEKQGGPEGYVTENILSTHLAGPVLVKDPELTDLLIRRSFTAKGWELPSELPRLPHEQEAYEHTLRSLRGRLTK